MKARVKFSKQGNMKFIGHLDVMRYFQKAIRRAGIDIAYTEGLSPHMIMSFASPLGVGLTSDAEYMDIELRTPIPSREAIDALNRVGVEGITVTGFYEIPEDKANKAMTLVAAADYTVRFRAGYEPERLPRRKISGDTAERDDTAGRAGDASSNQRKDSPVRIWKNLSSAVEEFCAQDKIPAWKKTKKSEKEVDIRPMIYEMRCVPDAVFLRLASGSVANLKPELVMDTLLGRYGIEASPFAYEINRCELYANIGSAKQQSQAKPDGCQTPAEETGSEGSGEAGRILTPLSALGREIL